MKLNIGLLTYKRNDLLRGLLESIVAQDIKGLVDKIKVTVVDTTGYAESSIVVESFKGLREDIEFDLVALSTRSDICEGRNIILREANYEWLLMVDDDQAIPEGVLRKAIEEIKQNTTEVCVAKLGIKSEFLGESADLKIANLPMFQRDIPYEHGTFFKGGSCAAGGVFIKMSRVRETQVEFRAEMAADGGEDNLFFHELCKDEVEVLSLKNIKCSEYIPSSRVKMSYALADAQRRGICSSNFLLITAQSSPVMIIKNAIKVLAILTLKLPFLLLKNPSRLNEMRVHYSREWGKVLGVFGKEQGMYK